MTTSYQPHKYISLDFFLMQATTNKKRTIKTYTTFSRQLPVATDDIVGRCNDMKVFTDEGCSLTSECQYPSVLLIPIRFYKTIGDLNNSWRSTVVGTAKIWVNAMVISSASYVSCNSRSLGVNV